TQITKASYDHWYSVLSKGGGQTTTPPDPPGYVKCIAAKRAALPKPAKGQPTTTDAQLKTQCDSEYKAIQQQAMQLLISYDWLVGEAKDQGITVTDADVQKQFETQKKASFPKEADYQKFLTTSGQSEADILMRVKLDVLSNKIREKITAGTDQVADADITKYYNANKARFAQPERRDLLVVLTKTQDAADKAKAAIQGGTAWAKVAKKYSIDQASKAQGGKLAAVAKGQQEKALDDAVFSAKKNVLTGPIKTQFGYYDFKVTTITPASQQTQAQASATIKQLLTSQNQQKALDDFVKMFTTKWTSQTVCKEGYKTTDCANGPKPTPTPTVPTGTAPQVVTPGPTG
ncbi:MAG: foldase protein PrsA, partial [Solirubrobacteraceae bacterium]|nr:foldase protein PrsA [Solirubrobacteraceae bacterium]